MYKITKLLSICCMLLCSVFLFTGCTTISQTFSINSDGSRTENFSFTLDETEIHKINSEVNMDNLLEDLTDLVDDWWNDISATKDLTKVHFSNVIGSTKYSRSITIAYDTYEAWADFSGAVLTTPTPSIVETGIFSDKRVIYDGVIDTGLFNHSYKFTDLINNFQTYVADTYFDSDTSIIEGYFNNITLYIARAYPSNALVHSNANKTIKNSITSVHIWETTFNDLVNSETTTPMYIYQTVYNGHNITNWYLLALAITIILGGILAIILVYKKKQTALDSKYLNNTDINDTSVNNNSEVSNNSITKEATNVEKEVEPSITDEATNKNQNEDKE